MNDAMVWLYIVVFLALVGFGGLVINGIQLICQFFMWLSRLLDGDDE